MTLLPYLNPKEVNNKFVELIEDIKSRSGPPPWRAPILATENFRMIIHCWPPGHRFPKHYHKKGDESWYILEGKVEAIFDDQPAFIAKPGSILFAEKEVIHDMTVIGDEPLLMLTIVSPNDPEDQEVYLE